MNKDIIKATGLSDNETEVYLILLSQKESLASDVAKKSKISRPHIYDTIAKLIDKGLANYVIKNNKKYFKPADPDVLLELLKSKETSLQQILPDLKKIYSPEKEAPTVEVYEGKAGLKNILNQLLKNNDEFLAFGPTIQWKEQVPIALQQYFKRREKLGFKARMLCPEGKKILKHPLNEFKFIPAEYSSPATTIMYGNKTCFVLWLETVISVIIENKELSDSFKNYFEMVWNQRTKTYHGEKAAQMFMDDIIKTKPKEYLVIGSTGRIADIMPKEWKEWDEKKASLNISTKRIYDESEQGRRMAEKYQESKLRETKFMPLEGGESPFNTAVYNDRVWIFNWQKGNPFVMLIEDKEIANGFKDQFNTLWNQKERIYRGLEGVKQAFMKIIEDKPKEVCAYGSSGVSPIVMPDFIKKWHELRVKNKIKAKVMYVNSKEGRKRAKEVRIYVNTESKVMSGNYISPVTTFLYDNKVILISITKNGFATIIENKEIFNSYKKQFDIMWNNS
ncbi:MAG: hypothetical protein KKF89_01210 [Nanoarchaeota archaeon]|nr:hypothetical protein [Nanoarchaeota archaeon]MBU1854315.1 hypothetical protein [Nanoarchaeota archaeon]